MITGFDDPLSLDELAERVQVFHSPVDPDFDIYGLPPSADLFRRAHVVLAVLKSTPKPDGSRLLDVIKNRYPTLRGSPLWPSLIECFPSLHGPTVVVPDRLEGRLARLVVVDATDYAKMRLIW